MTTATSGVDGRRGGGEGRGEKGLRRVILVIIGYLFILFTYEIQTLYTLSSPMIFMSFLLLISGNSFILEIYSVG